MVPVLDEWVQKGGTVNEEELRDIIQKLNHYRRFKHALEISQWMSDKRYIPLMPRDIALRMNLILKVHGLEQVENYFNNIHKNLKTYQVYIALLNCYALEKSVDKAEAIMQRLRDLGFVRTALGYNTLMNVYYRMGNWEKLDILMHEMEEKGIFCDKFTLAIRLSAYAAASNIVGIDNIVTRMESDPRIILDWNSYAVVAHGYLKVGLVDKTLVMMKKLEELIDAKGSNVAFDNLLKLYAETRQRDELDRVWMLYKKKEKIYNKGYMAMISSLLKFDDIDAAEKVLEEWESRRLSYDFRVPNFLIDAYCRKGLTEKAEALVNKILTKGGNPLVDTWFYLANGYLEDSQIPKAVEALKKAVVVCPPNWKPSKNTLATCLEYLEGNRDVEGAGEFIRFLQNEGIFSVGVCKRLLSYIENGKPQPNRLGEIEGDV